MLALLVIATIGDLGIAALVVAVSGSVIGDGPQATNNPALTAALSSALAGCLLAPAAGFVLRWRGFASAGATVALVPVMLGIILALGGP